MLNFGKEKWPHGVILGKMNGSYIAGSEDVMIRMNK